MNYIRYAGTVSYIEKLVDLGRSFAIVVLAPKKTWNIMPIFSQNISIISYFHKNYYGFPTYYHLVVYSESRALIMCDIWKKGYNRKKNRQSYKITFSTGKAKKKHRSYGCISSQFTEMPSIGGKKKQPHSKFKTKPSAV